MLQNYNHPLWALIYDEFSSQTRRYLEYKFYKKFIKKYKNPKVLDIACGTGEPLLKFLQQGINIYGFDISKHMLNQLYKKAKNLNLNIKKRISIQNMTNFKYNFKFDIIYIASRSFLHLVKLDDQIKTLENIYNHLKNNGVFICNLYTPSLDLILKYSKKENQKFYFLGEFNINKKFIKLYCKEEQDLTNKIQNLTFKFIYNNKEYTSKMRLKWLFKDEFELLLRLAGFNKISLYSNFKNKKYNFGDELVWVAKK